MSMNSWLPRNRVRTSKAGTTGEACPLLLQAAGRGTGGRRIGSAANRVSGQHKLHAPILLPSSRGVVGGHRRALAQTARHDRFTRDALLDQVIADGAGPSF